MTHKFKHLYIKSTWGTSSPLHYHFTKIKEDQDLLKVSTILSAMAEVSSRYWSNWSSLQSAIAPSPSGSSGVCGQYDFTSPSTCPMYYSVVVETNCWKHWGTFRSLPTNVSGSSSFPSRISTTSTTAWAATLSSLSCSSSYCIKSRDSDKSFSYWRVVAISWSESALIFLSFSISSAFRYIRIFRYSTKLSSIFNDFEKAMYSIKRNTYKYQTKKPSRLNHTC